MGGGFFNLRCNEGSITLIQGFHHPSHFLFWGFIWEGGMLRGIFFQSIFKKCDTMDINIAIYLLMVLFILDVDAA